MQAFVGNVVASEVFFHDLRDGSMVTIPALAWAGAGHILKRKCHPSLCVWWLVTGFYVWFLVPRLKGDKMEEVQGKAAETTSRMEQPV